MALKIMVSKNHFPTCASPYLVRSGKSDTIEFDRFVEIMAKGRTTLTKTDILATMQLYKEELQKLLAEGMTVKTPTGAFYLSAKGCMEALDESFLPQDQANNHDVRLHHRVDLDLEEAIKAELKIVREERPDLSAPLLFAASPAGEDDGASIRPGGMVEVRGKRLRFDPKEADQGLFFRDALGAEARSPFYPMVNPSMVLASVPDTLAPGSYALVLRAAVNGKDVRESRLEGVVILSR